MRRASDQWPEEKVERLKQLWADGWSASQIAAELGGFQRCADGGRSAVLGKSFRLGLAQRATSFRSPRPRRVPTPHGLGKRIQARKNGHHVQPPTPLPAVDVVDSEIPLSQRKTLIGLENHHCRWPVGDPGEDGFFFCGDPSANAAAGRPYCAAHAKRARGNGAIELSDAERLRRAMQGKKNHVSAKERAA